MRIELDFSTYLSEYENYEKHYFDLIKSSFDFLQLKFSPIISVSLMDNENIHVLNREYRGIDRPTDVISFAYLDNDPNKDLYFKGDTTVVLGEIYISIPKAIEQAQQYNHSLKREMSFLFVHGLLHLLGYDHMNENDEKIMFDLQNKILEKEGILR